MQKKTGHDICSRKGRKQIPEPVFRTKISDAILEKIESTPRIANLLKESHVPIMHYYVRKKPDGTEYALPLKKYEWICLEIMRIRDKLNGINPNPKQKTIDIIQLNMF